LIVKCFGLFSHLLRLYNIIPTCLNIIAGDYILYDLFAKRISSDRSWSTDNMYFTEIDGPDTIMRFQVTWSVFIFRIFTKTLYNSSAMVCKLLKQIDGCIIFYYVLPTIFLHFLTKKRFNFHTTHKSNLFFW